MDEAYHHQVLDVALQLTQAMQTHCQVHASQWFGLFISQGHRPSPNDFDGALQLVQLLHTHCQVCVSQFAWSILFHKNEDHHHHDV